MGTTITNPSNTTAKVRWLEPYVSEGVNKKLNGVVPAGVVRGGKLGTSGVNLSVTVEADPVTGDSVYSYIDANGAQVTFRQVGNITLDLTPFASTTVYIALHIDYTVSADTDVYWKAYTYAELFGGAPDPEAPYVIVVGRVDVPAAGIISASDIYPDECRIAWENVAQGTREWTQAIADGSFELSKVATLPGSAAEFPGWDTSSDGYYQNNVTVDVSQASPRTGAQSLRCVLSGGANERFYLYRAGRFIPVYPGQRIKGSVWVSGSALAPGAGANGHLGVTLTFYDKNFGLLGTTYISDISLTGGFLWTEVAGIIEAPSSAYWMRARVEYNDDNQSSTGTLYFDDFRVWLEVGHPADDEYEPEATTKDVVQAGQVDIIGRGTVSTLSDYIGKIVTLLGIDGLSVAGTTERRVSMLSRGGDRVALQLLKGSLEVQRQIRDIGLDLLGSSAEALTARLKATLAAQATEDVTLLAQLTQTDPNLGKFRVYAGPQFLTATAFGALYVTSNAVWNGATWVRDDASKDSWIVGLTGTYRMLWAGYRKNTEADGWSNNDWWNNGHTPIQMEGSLVGADPYFSWYLDNPRFQCLDTTTISNPAPGAAVLPNGLYAKNIPKAWCQFDWAGAVVGNPENFGMELAAAGTRLTFTLDQSMANTDYTVHVQFNHNTLWWILGFPYIISGKAVNQFDVVTLILTDNNPGPIDIEEVDADSIAGTGQIVVFGQQDT